MPIAVVGFAVLVLLVSAVRAWPGARAIGDLPAALTRVAVALRTPWPNAILTPFRVVVAPSYAATAHDWLIALYPAIAVLLLHIAWVLRADAVFEEAAVEASARRAERVAQYRAREAGAALPSVSVMDKVSGSMAAVRLERAPVPGVRWRRMLLPLAPTGDPAIAILWKNTLALLRGLRLRTAALVAVMLGVFVTMIRQFGLLGDVPTDGGGAVLLGALSFVAALFLILLGPIAVRNDLRQDLLHMDFLRALPLRGRSIVFAEVASSTLALTLVQWLLLSASYAFLAAAPADADAGVRALFSAEFPDRLTMVAVAIAVLPVINGASFLVQNAAALLFPGWMRLGPGGVGGLEIIGQRLIGFGAALITLGVFLTIPASIVAAILMSRPADAVTSATLLAAVTVGVLVGAVEIWLAVLWLGHRFERTDSNAILPTLR